MVVEDNAARIRGRTFIRMVAGDNDALFPRDRRYHELLNLLDLAHDFVILPGLGHDPEALYAALGAGGFAFYRMAFGG